MTKRLSANLARQKQTRPHLASRFSLVPGETAPGQLARVEQWLQQIVVILGIQLEELVQRLVILDVAAYEVLGIHQHLLLQQLAPLFFLLFFLLSEQGGQ